MGGLSVPQSSSQRMKRLVKPQHPAFPSEACAFHARCGHAFRQVFGLAGFLLTPASQSKAGPVLILERSFLLTAAGQFRIFTGFPFQPDHKGRAPESIASIYHCNGSRNQCYQWCLHSMLGVVVQISSYNQSILNDDGATCF